MAVMELIVHMQHNTICDFDSRERELLLKGYSDIPKMGT